MGKRIHRSNSNPDALLDRKANAHPVQASYRGHVPMDIRHARIVDCRVTQMEPEEAASKRSRRRANKRQPKHKKNPHLAAGVSMAQSLVV
jgi:hypothetical protein